MKSELRRYSAYARNSAYDINPPLCKFWAKNLNIQRSRLYLEIFLKYSSELSVLNGMETVHPSLKHSDTFKGPKSQNGDEIMSIRRFFCRIPKAILEYTLSSIRNALMIKNNFFQ